MPCKATEAVISCWQGDPRRLRRKCRLAVSVISTGKAGQGRHCLGWDTLTNYHGLGFKGWFLVAQSRDTIHRRNAGLV